MLAVQYTTTPCRQVNNFAVSPVEHELRHFAMKLFICSWTAIFIVILPLYRLSDVRVEFMSALSDDFNTYRALDAIMNLVNAANQQLQTASKVR